MRRLKENWRIALDDNLYYPEFNYSEIEGNPNWGRENVQGFHTKEGAEDYISKTVILEKRRFVEDRDN